MREVGISLPWLVAWPSPESFSEGKWVEIGARRVFQLPLLTAGQTRTLSLLEALVTTHLPTIQRYQPQAVVLGTARGEMEYLFSAYETWRQGGGVSPWVSPYTTVGTLASQVARWIGITGPAWTVSQTCISGLLALYQAFLLLRSGEAERVLFGAVEAPLHPFFLEAMGALRLYSRETEPLYTRPGSGANTLTLGEAVSIGILARASGPFLLKSVGVGTAPAVEGVSLTAVSPKAVEAFLRQMGDGRPDFVVLHAPGTRQGDKAEWEAVKRVWGEVPALSVKAWVGHSLGVAPLVSLSWAMYLLSTQRWLELPYKPHWPSYPPQRWQEAVVLALGFGGVMGAIWIQKAAL